MRRTAESLAFGAHAIREDFADVDPDYRSLGDGEKGDVGYEEPQQIILMLVGEKNARDASEAQRGADGPDQQQSLASELVDYGHAQQRGQQVRAAYGDGLQVAGKLAETGGGKNIVQ